MFLIYHIFILKKYAWMGHSFFKNQVFNIFFFLKYKESYLKISFTIDSFCFTHAVVFRISDVYYIYDF